MHFDDILKNHVGQLGRFQVRLVAVLCLEEVFLLCATLNTIYSAAVPGFWCEVPELTEQNCTANQLLQLTSPHLGQDRYDTCHVYDLNYSHVSAQADVCLSTQAVLNHTLGGASNATGTRDCHAWSYDKTLYESTITSEWDLVCNKAWLVSTANAVFMAGRATGNFIFGFLADRFGRRTTVLWSTLMVIVCGMACAFAPNILFLLVARFLWANFASGKTNTAYVIAMEYSGPDWRMISTNIYFGFWCLGYLVLAGVAYLIREWRLLVAVTCAPEIIFWILFFIYVPESPRWLLARNREKEARKILKRMVKMNHSTMPDSLPVTSKEKISTKTIIDLFTTSGIRMLTISLCFIWFVETFAYYGLALSSAGLGGNPYLSVVLMGVIEIPACAVATLISKYCGRVLPQSACLVLAGLTLFMTIFVNSESLWMVWVIHIIGKSFINCAFVLIWLYTSEAYPTCVRNIGLTATSVAGRLASVLAAYVAMLADVWKPLPLVVIGSLSLAAAGLMLLMPETRGVKLPQTIEDGETFLRKSPMRFCKRRNRKTGDGIGTKQQHETKCLT